MNPKRLIDLSSIQKNLQVSYGDPVDMVPGRITKHPDGSMTREVQPVYSWHTPAPYSFKYTPLIVKCDSCKAEFPIEELIEVEDVDDDGDDYISERKCPKCLQEFTETVANETIEEALKRKEQENG